MINAPTTLKLLAASVLAAALLAPATTMPAEAGYSKGKRYSSSDRRKSHAYRNRYDRRDAAEREYDRARAESVDPGGSYSAYPDWARYALSPKSNR